MNQILNSGKVIFMAMLLIWSHQGLCQKGYLPGYVVQQSGDTVRGLLRFDSESRNASPCYFKQTEDAQPQTYTPGQITSFRFTNDAYFISRSIGRSADVFLEVVIRSHMTLYKFGDIFFLEKADSAFFELSDDTEVLMVEGQNVRKKSRNYVRLLNLLMADCLEATRKIPTIPFREKPLIKLVLLYNTCVGHENKFYRSQMPQ
ncbi:MAG: hypothetical protein JNK10_09610 [Cyclobacteriaceae bacterium]|nr:hypothetical protein [Cyclobacteriaceae bacterium]